MKNNKTLYESIMKNISNSIKSVLEMIDIPENDENAEEYEISNGIKDCLNQLNTTGGAYLDWGLTGEINKNINSKKIAVIIGHKFQNKGYFVYYQGIGKGMSYNPSTPAVLRITKRPHVLGKYESEF